MPSKIEYVFNLVDSSVCRTVDDMKAYGVVVFGCDVQVYGFMQCCVDFTWSINYLGRKIV